jgi:hypothetical protein
LGKEKAMIGRGNSASGSRIDMASRWSATVKSWPLAGALAFIVALLSFIMFAARSSGWVLIAISAVVGAGVFVAALVLIALRVNVGEDGVTIRSALLGLTLKAIPLSAIDSVGVVTVRPSQWGGWGVRRRGKRIAFLLRGGPAVEVSTKDGHCVIVTVPNPDIPVSILRTLVVRPA